MSDPNVRVYCLFEGRHPLPENLGPLFTMYDFEYLAGTKTPFGAISAAGHDNALTDLEFGRTVKLIITGLTPALTEFMINAYQQCAYQGDREADIQFTGTLILLHWNKKKQEYFEQVVFAKS